MNYSLATIWHGRNRYLPGVLAVAFSELLILVQTGVLLGLLAKTSLPIDKGNAHLWVGYPGVESVDTGRPIPADWEARVAREPGVLQTETYLIAFLVVDKRNPEGETTTAQCTVIGVSLEPGSLGAIDQLDTDKRSKLTELGAIIVDESAVKGLGFDDIGDYAEVFDHRVRLVDTVTGIKGLAGPYVFCSRPTASLLMEGTAADETIFVLARCEDEATAAAVAQRLNEATDVNVSAFTSKEFSFATQWFWMTTAQAGLVTLWGALLGLLVGAAVTGQTLYAATAASMREYAVLQALGIPRWRMALAVLGQSFWVGVAGTALGLGAAFGLRWLLGERAIAEFLGLGGEITVALPWWLVASATAVVMVMASLAGLAALWSLRLLEPTSLLRA